MNSITFIISTLRGGGAERVVSNMANYWAERRQRITVITYGQGDEPVSYDLHPDIAHRRLKRIQPSAGPEATFESNAALNKFFMQCSPIEREVMMRSSGRIEAMREAIIDSRPDAIISFIDATNILVLLATRGLDLPVIISERVDPRCTSIGAGWETLREQLYPEAKCLVAQTEEALSYFSKRIRRCAQVIPNFALPPPIAASSANGSSAKRVGKTLIAMGRLTDQKGFDLLIQAFAAIADKHPSWKLEIWGKGDQQSNLEDQARKLGLENRVRFPGFTRRPSEALCQADLFALSSRYEGFPNALCEAMACGLPAISFDCPSGPRCIIRDGLDGLLVPPNNTSALAASLDRLMNDEAERSRMASRAAEIVERFSAEKVMGMWERLVFNGH